MVRILECPDMSHKFRILEETGGFRKKFQAIESRGLEKNPSSRLLHTSNLGNATDLMRGSQD